MPRGIDTCSTKQKLQLYTEGNVKERMYSSVYNSNYDALTEHTPEKEGKREYCICLSSSRICARNRIWHHHLNFRICVGCGLAIAEHVEKHRRGEPGFDRTRVLMFLNWGSVFLKKWLYSLASVWSTGSHRVISSSIAYFSPECNVQGMTQQRY